MPWHTEISSIRMSAFYLIFIILFTDNFGNKITRYRFPLVQQLQVDSLHWVCAICPCAWYVMCWYFLQVKLQVKMFGADGHSMIKKHQNICQIPSLSNPKQDSNALAIAHYLIIIETCECDVFHFQLLVWWFFFLKFKNKFFSKVF